MKTHFIKSLVVSVCLIITSSALSAQSLKESFSAEGRENWKTEFTFRGKVGIYTGGSLLSGGVRIDDKRTMGLMVGEQTVYYDADPATVNYISTSLFWRRYFHLGKRQRFSFYSDLSASLGGFMK